MSESGSARRRNTELDSIDWAILGVLQADAMTPNKEIAAAVGVAPSTCLERVRRMRESGVIASVRAHVDPARVGRGEQALLAIQVRPHSRETANDFVRKVLEMPETLTLYNVSGAEDYLVHVAVRDSTALQALIIDRLLALPQVAHCRTQLIFGEPLTAPLRRAGTPAR
ncbi:Lrp/AsnC family transcriptional regulator [Agromyces sp. H66]|uniref:Lrp/AsnC family transcriptional regulator n=1 Tax=Agromyces sp. H66 TaxID=2529859 RepID=UPI0010AB2DA9|nr:Lrp/AsnC family transcriptional regulator [Agromyces sp. H66]